MSFHDLAGLRSPAQRGGAADARRCRAAGRDHDGRSADLSAPPPGHAGGGGRAVAGPLVLRLPGRRWRDLPAVPHRRHLVEIQQPRVRRRGGRRPRAHWTRRSDNRSTTARSRSCARTCPASGCSRTTPSTARPRHCAGRRPRTRRSSSWTWHGGTDRCARDKNRRKGGAPKTSPLPLREGAGGGVKLDAATVGRPCSVRSLPRPPPPRGRGKICTRRPLS